MWRVCATIARHVARKFRADVRATAAVELAIIAGPLFATLFAILEVGWDWYSLNALDAAAQNAARQIMTGTAQTTTVNGQQMTASQFRTNIVCPMLPAYCSCSNVIVNISTFAAGVSPSGYYALLNSSQTDVQQPPLDNTRTNYCIGSSGAYVLLQVIYPMPLLTNVFMNMPMTTLNGQKVVLLTANATFRNEPFPAGSFVSPAGC